MTLPLDELRRREFRKILLIKLSAVGDVVHTLPVLNKFRRRYPNAQIDWLVTPAIGELLRHHPALNSVVDFERDTSAPPWAWSALSSYVRLARKLRLAGYDLVIDLHGQSRTAFLAFVTGAPIRIGFDKERPKVWENSRQVTDDFRKHAWQGAREGAWLFYTHPVPLPTMDVHVIDHYQSVGALLDFDAGPTDFTFQIPQAARDRVESLLGRYGIGSTRPVVIAPRGNWETKRWPDEKSAEIARHFLQRGHAVVLVGAPREHAVGEAIARLAPGLADLTGATTLSELAALIERAALCIAHDSGPLHLAVALGRPVVALFGPSDPVWAGPYHRDNASVRAGLPCSPCYLRRLESCRHEHGCMNKLSVQAVIERAEHVLSAALTTV
ncbi:MAG: lipopolysaccharide heptosyltransferase II [Xanthobacteraceae bacterium]